LVTDETHALTQTLAAATAATAVAAMAAAAAAMAAAAATADTTEVPQEVLQEVLLQAAVLQGEDMALVPGQATTEAGVAATGELAIRAPPMTEAATEEGTVVGLPREEVRTTGVSGAVVAGELPSEREIGIVMPPATPLQLWPVLL
jgi:hypothetical protein